MAGLKPHEKVQRDWERLVIKLSNRAVQGQSVYLLADEVRTLVTSMDEITTQALLLQKVIQKYPDLWDNLVETLNVKPGTVQDVRGLQSSDGSSPEAVHYAAEAGGLYPVAGGADA